MFTICLPKVKMPKTIHLKKVKVGKYKLEVRIIKVKVRNGHTTIKAFARILKPKKVYAFDKNYYLAEVEK